MINLATGSNETQAAAQAVSSLISLVAPLPSSSDPSSGAVPMNSASSEVLKNNAPHADRSGGSDGENAEVRAGESPKPKNDPAVLSGVSNNAAAHNAEDAVREGGSGDMGFASNEGGGKAQGPVVTGGGATSSTSEKGGEGGEEGRGVGQGLEGMSTGNLVASFRRAQEERVALYKKFNGRVVHRKGEQGQGTRPPTCISCHVRSSTLMVDGYFYISMFRYDFFFVVRASRVACSVV